MKDLTLNENLIVFESNPDFSDNPRGYWEYINENTDYETCWVIKDASVAELLSKNNIKCVVKDTEEAERVISSSKYFITSSFEFAYAKRKDQIHISAWHGFPLKVIGYFDSATSNGSNEFYDNLKVITTQSDIITASSRLSRLTMSGLLATDPRKVKETGFPRNDLLFKYDARKELQKLVNFDLGDSKLLLYLPTMRKGLKKEGNQFDDNIFNYDDYDVEIIENYLEDNDIYIFAKLHFADNDYFKNSKFRLPKRIVLLDTEMLTHELLTIYHIMNCFDALITDYSSVYVDYLLLDKPIIFSCPDIEQYKKDRGFVVDDPRYLMPGAFVDSQKGLIDNIDKIINNIDEYKSERDNKISLFHQNVDANSSKRLLLEMENVEKNGTNDSSRLGNLYLPNSSPLNQYTLYATANFYFDRGDGFSESEKKSIFYQINFDNEKVDFNIDIPEGTNVIRFDPDKNGRWLLSNFRAKEDDVEAEYYVAVGKKINDLIILDHNNPQIIIDSNNINKRLTISFNCQDLYANIDVITKEIDSLKIANEQMFNKVQCMENSTSWKITKPLRTIKKKFR